MCPISLWELFGCEKGIPCVPDGKKKICRSKDSKCIILFLEYCLIALFNDIFFTSETNPMIINF
jgi:hypothetical protein